MRKLYLALGIVPFLALTGCGFTAYGDAVRTEGYQKAKEAAAQSLANTEALLCRGLPVGAVQDRYGGSKDKAEAYNELCGHPDNSVIDGE